MSDSASRNIVLSAAFTVIFLIAGAIAIYIYLEETPGQGEPDAGYGESAMIDAPDEGTDVVSR